MYIITISRQTASLGDEVARNLADKLGIDLIDRDYVVSRWLPGVADKHQLHMLKESPNFYSKKTDRGITFAEYVENKLINISRQKPLVILGLGSQIIFRNEPTAIHVRIVASDKSRINHLKNEYGLPKNQASRSLELSDRKHRKYVWKIYNEDWSEPELYHICLTMDGFSINEAADQIIYLQELKKENPRAIQEIETGPSSEDEDENGDNRVYAHPSEKEFARILDMHNIKWEFEPTEFPLEWDAEGNISMGFRPDFYLPEHDTYIELTTMKQKYVTEKNKKIRLLNKLYPEVNINIVYKKDFKSIIERFGV